MEQSKLQRAREEVKEIMSTLDAQTLPCAGHEVADVFHRCLQKLEAADANEAEKAPLIYEVRLWFMRPESVLRHSAGDAVDFSLADRFHERGRESEYLPRESVLYFEERARHTGNPFLRARYADFLAVRAANDGATEKLAARGWALQAITAYLESARIQATSQSASQSVHHQHEAVESLGSAACLALCKAHDQLAPVVKALHEYLEFSSDENLRLEFEGSPLAQGRWAADCGWILLGVRSKAKTVVSDSELAWWQQVSERLAVVNGESSDHLWEQKFFSQAAEAARLRGAHGQRFDLLRQLGAAKVREAQAHTKGNGASFLAAASMMEDAVKFLDRLRSMTATDEDRAAISEEQRLLKLEIRRYYREGESEMGVVTHSVDVKRKDIEAAVAPILKPVNLSDCLKCFGASFLCNPRKAKEWADARSKEVFLHSIIGTSLMSEQMEIRNYHSEEEKWQFEFNRLLDYQIQMHSTLLLPLAWQRLQETKGLTTIALMGYFDASGLIEEENRPFVQRGIEHYFADDFVSALHLLAPQLEDVIRTLFERAGLPPAHPVKSGNGWQYETFGAVLRRVDEALPEFFPADLRLYVERTLTDPTGWNLRNAIAHGFIKLHQCNRLHAETVLHIFLSFALFCELIEGKERDA
jgi:hypothetical protein